MVDERTAIKALLQEMAARIPFRLPGRQLCQVASRRNFATRSQFLDAQNFTMPAISPTMTEGNISRWKVREGDSFSTGDVLLEIETDMATMDVEAQEDGIMAKILQADGAKGVRVGTRIAVLAEAGDDISSLEIPLDDSNPAPKQAAKKEDPKPEAPQSSEAAPSKALETQQSVSASPSPRPASGAGRNSKYPLYPAVTALLHEYHIPESEIPKIRATGPNGRLLKGDVLSYLGRIQADYSSAQSTRIQHLSHMDLSNIKVAPRAEKQPGPSPDSPPPAAHHPPEIPAEISISLSISLSEVLKVQKRVEDTLGVSIPLSTFLARAVEIANDDLPKPKGARPSSDDLFNAVLGLGSMPKTSRGSYMPQINALASGTAAPEAAPEAAPALSHTTGPVKREPDIIDILTGSAAVKPGRRTAGSSTVGIAANATAGAMNVFRVTVPSGEERRAKTFLERVKTVLQVEPGRLIL